MTKRTILALLVVLMLLATVGVVWAQSSPDHDNSWHVVAAGGREGMTSGSHTMHGTMGQFAIGPASSEQHAVGSGYWYGIRGVEEVLFKLYLPLVLLEYDF